MSHTVLKQNILIGGGCIILGVLIGLSSATLQGKNENTVLRENSEDYQFINPLLLADIGNNEEPGPYLSLKDSVSRSIEMTVKEGDAREVSVYFRNLNTGIWFGINADEEYSPSSMLKVAVLISYLRAVEKNPSIAQQQIYIAPSTVDLNEAQFYKSVHPITPGRSYSTQELVRAMIVESDNNAMSLIKQLVGDEYADKIYQDLAIPISRESGSLSNLDFMSARLYSRFFRTLYNGTYLSHRNSEEVLRLLSQSSFTKGLVAGVPTTVTVAHKFGERTILDASGTVVARELHDCGIIYHATHPYVLCVMTRGDEFNKLESVIAHISSLVWEWQGTI